MKSTYSENEIYLLNYYITARFCVVSYTAGSLLLFGVTQRQERCVAPLECGIFTGCPRGSEPPGHKGNNVIDVVRLFACLFFCGRLCFRKNRNSRANNHFSWTKHYYKTGSLWLILYHCLPPVALKNIASTSCTVEDANCGVWANKGECCKNPAYMLEHCCAACKDKVIE